MAERMSLAKYNAMPKKDSINAGCSRAKRKSPEKQTLINYLAASGLPWVKEHRFHPKRQWEIDWVLKDIKVGLEFEGGVFVSGGHTRGKEFSNNCEKYTEAAILDWLVVRVTAPMVRDGRAFDLIERAVKAREVK